MLSPSPIPQPKNAAPSEPTRLPSLDGWRAFSIFLVLGAHSTRTVDFPSALKPAFAWLFDGDFGVRCFFLISGFLITWLMIHEHDSRGGVHLKHFYARRALRILPVYGAYLAVVGVIQWLTPFHQDARVWTANLTFTTNFLPEANWVTGHLWSLAVEEQFYLLWPTLFVLLGLGSHFRRAGMVLILAIAFAPVARVITYAMAGGSQVPILATLADCAANPDSGCFPLRILFTTFSFFNYCDSIAMGALFAYLSIRRRDTIRAFFLSRGSALVFVVAAVLILTPYIARHLQVLNSLTVPMGNTLEACGFGLLLLHSVYAPAWGPYRMLNWRWVRRIGVLSYSIYIWQQLFCTAPQTFGLQSAWCLSFPGWLLAVFAVAALSYYGFERPLLMLRARLRHGG